MKEEVRNTGSVVMLDLNNMTKEEKEDCACEFAEGSEELKNLLLKLWDKGITTYACCAGHRDKDNVLTDAPYLFFDVRQFDENRLKHIVSSCLRGFENRTNDFAFVIDYIVQNRERRAISIKLKNKQMYKEFFSFVDKLIFGEEEIVSKKENEEMIESILSMFKLSIHNYIKNAKDILPYKLVGIRGTQFQLFLTTLKMIEKNDNSSSFKEFNLEEFDKILKEIAEKQNSYLSV